MRTRSRVPVRARWRAGEAKVKRGGLSGRGQFQDGDPPAALPNFLITEYFVNFEPRGREIAVTPFAVEGGYLAVPTTPGLGIELKEDVLARHAHRDFPPRAVPTPREEGP